MNSLTQSDEFTQMMNPLFRWIHLDQQITHPWKQVLATAVGRHGTIVTNIGIWGGTNNGATCVHICLRVWGNVGNSSWMITPAAGGRMTVVAGTEVSALVDDDRVGRTEAATVSVGTERADHGRDNSRCRTDNAWEVPGSRGVVDVDKELTPTVACVVSRLLQRVGVQGGWLCNMLQIN